MQEEKGQGANVRLHPSTRTQWKSSPSPSPFSSLYSVHFSFCTLNSEQWTVNTGPGTLHSVLVTLLSPLLRSLLGSRASSNHSNPLASLSRVTSGSEKATHRSPIAFQLTHRHTRTQEQMSIATPTVQTASPGQLFHPHTSRLMQSLTNTWTESRKAKSKKRRLRA